MLSSRARKENAWFLEQFRRPLSRQASKSSSNLDLATAENWLIRPEILPLLKQNAQSLLTAEHLSYSGGLGGTPELLGALSAFFNHFFSPKVPVRPEHVVTGPGCSAILDTWIHDICDDGDGLLLASPMWGAYQASRWGRLRCNTATDFLSRELRGIRSVAQRRATNPCQCTFASDG